MTTKAIITQRNTISSGMLATDDETTRAATLGLDVEQTLPQGTLVKGSESQYRAIESQGFRVKLLTDTNILEVGSYRIDTEEGPAKVPAKLDVPGAEKKTWPHHLVQLAAPPNEDWVNSIEQKGVDVVEPVSGYGLFVAGEPEEVDKLKDLPFVEWTGPFKPAYRISPDLADQKGTISNVSIGVYPSDRLEEVKASLLQAGDRIIHEGKTPAAYGGEFGKLLIETKASRIAQIASMPWVRWVEFRPPMHTDGERETQIVAENLDGAPPPATAPVTGYQAWLASAGLSGGGVTVAIADSGVDAGPGNNTSGHTDLRGRQTAFVDYTGGTGTTDTDGHGTNVAGIAVGNAGTGQTEAPAPANFLWGQGIAPGAGYVTQNFLSSSATEPTTQNLIRDASVNGANVMNNSWSSGASGGTGYSSQSRTIDQAVRDPNSVAAGLENLTIVCSSGNTGGRDGSVNSPHESKNDIVVGNSLTSRPGGFPVDDIKGISGTSGRGPATDGRFTPTVVAPGTEVSAAFSRTSTRAPIAGTGVPDPSNPGSFIDQYISLSGTSQAAPHVTGSCALLIDWWRNRTGRTPSPALLKALLINGAEDLRGGENWRCLNRVPVDKATWSLESGSIYRRDMAFVPAALIQGNAALTQVASLAAITAAGQWFFDAAANRIFVRMTGSLNPAAANMPFLHARDQQPLPAIPNGHQGWGRVSLRNIVQQAPDSDRGPRICSDQRHAFTANLQTFTIRVAPVDNTRAMRVTLVWTDAAGAVNANPALVNDLDLEVTEILGPTKTGDIFKGNVFENGFSVTGGDFDNRNNVECVYLEEPGGIYDVTVRAANIAASARPDITTPWQDFALVIDNAEVASADPVNIVPVIDRSGSMIDAGYVDVTKTSSKQFVDMMNIDDQIGVISFGSTSTVEFPPGAAPTVHAITGPPVKNAVKTKIDDITFGGATYMGAGINAGRDLLSSVTSRRAMVLLSDGYDNKGGVWDPARPSALDAVATLPAGLPVYTCAMGPLSDQGLLKQIADFSSGHYYYMPTIDDLFEIYNYIRGRVTGDSIIVNTSAMASSNRVTGFVDSLATEATFTVAWANTALQFTPDDPVKTTQISIKLRDPRGKLLHRSDSYVRRTVGKGYVVFKLQEPIPGEWSVEVSTIRKEHTKFTVGGFVKSPLRLLVSLGSRILARSPLNIVTEMVDGGRKIAGFKAATSVIKPDLSIPNLLSKFKNQLRNIKIPAGGDVLPVDIAKLAVLRDTRLKAKKDDIFAHISKSVNLRKADIGRVLQPVNHGVATPDALLSGAGGPAAQPAAGLIGGIIGGIIGAIHPRVHPPTVDPSTILGALVGQFTKTEETGSYNVVVEASGTSPVSGARFVRKDMVSVRVE